MSHPVPPQPDEEEDLERDPVWAVLDQGRKISPSPSFSRRVVAAVQTGKTSSGLRWEGIVGWLTTFRQPLLATAAACLVLGTAWYFLAASPHPPSIPELALPSPPSPSLLPTEAEDLIQSLASELALLEKADQLLDPQDVLELEESDVEHLLF